LTFELDLDKVKVNQFVKVLFSSKVIVWTHTDKPTHAHTPDRLFYLNRQSSSNCYSVDMRNSPPSGYTNSTASDHLSDGQLRKELHRDDDKYSGMLGWMIDTRGCRATEAACTSAALSRDTVVSDR